MELTNLVMTRSLDQKLVINGNITVTVLKIRGQQVKLSIVAPKDVRVDREEIHEKRKAEQK